MFLTDCQACGLRELRGARSIELLVNADDGVELCYRCTRCQALNRTDQGRGRPAYYPRASSAA